MNKPNLTQKEANEIWLYDPQTGKLTNRYNRNPCAKALQEAGMLEVYRNGAMYRRIKYKGTKYMAHQIVWLMLTGEWPAAELDHDNGDTLDNRIENLRLSSRSENTKNRALNVNNKTGYAGIQMQKGRYQVMLGGVYKGIFETLDEAIKCRKAAEQEAGYNENHGKRLPTRVRYFNHDLTATPSKELR